MAYSNKSDKDQSFLKRRAFLLGAGQAALVGVLGARLGWLQIEQNERFTTLSEKNRIDMRLIAPERGLIYDRSGHIYAMNEQDFRAYIIPEQVDDIRQTLETLSTLIELRPSEIEAAIARAGKQARFVPVEVKGGLNWEQVSLLEVNNHNIAGVYVDTGRIRTYPYKDDTAHIVGYVGSVTRSDLEKGDAVLSLPGFKIGKSGLERSLEDMLRGKPGHKKVEVNVSGRVVRDLEVKAGEKGADVALTIHAELQNYTTQVLKEKKSASAVVMNPKTGEVYALVSHPSFDPNLFTSGLSVNQWEELLANEGKPLNNKAISGQYPPGSTFKMITALAGLEAGVITRNTTTTCPGHFDVNEHRFHCWKRSGHGKVDLVTALAESCDVYFYEMAREVGIERIADMARRFGLGETYGFELPEERAGLVPDKAWKRANRGEAWRPGETIVTSIGQGYILSTPLQLAVMTSRLINGGRAVKPWVAGALNHRFSARASQRWRQINVAKKHLDLVMEGMRAVTVDPQGTAHASRIDIAGFEMGGKTGTSQVRRISRAERDEGLADQSDIPWRFRHHALFVGYAPLKNPDYVISILVEHGGSGSAAAAPLAKKILKKAQELKVAQVPLTLPSNVDAAEAVKELRQKQARSGLFSAQEGGGVKQQEGAQNE
jgi:penicillin-binding protein 2